MPRLPQVPLIPERQASFPAPTPAADGSESYKRAIDEAMELDELEEGEPRRSPTPPSPQRSSRKRLQLTDDEEDIPKGPSRRVPPLGGQRRLAQSNEGQAKKRQKGNEGQSVRRGGEETPAASGSTVSMIMESAGITFF